MASNKTPEAAEVTLPAEGGCACAAIRYRITRAPMFVNCCHCGWCRRESGAAFAVNAIIETAAIEVLSGAPLRAQLPSESGRGQAVLRCGECGVALWSHYGGVGDAVAFVRAGTLDAPQAIRPDMHIYTEFKLPWLPLDDSIASTAGYYRRRECWSTESLARWDAVLAAAS